MMMQLAARCRSRALGLAAVLMAATAGAPLGAQGIQTIDPDSAIDADLNAPPRPPAQYDYPVDPPAQQPAPPSPSSAPSVPTPVPAAPYTPPPTVGTYDNGNRTAAAATTASADGTTYKEDDLIGAAEGLFGKGAEGLARLIQDILAKQGEPNAYIVGREGGGAFVLGVRYGSGTLFHKVEGQRPVYWTGPSIGFDAGANAGNTFVLVYNLYDTEELYERYPSGEGQAYLIGGFNASYLRKGDTVLIPIRVGAGLRLGVNAGYMRFSKQQRWLPF